MNLAPTRDRQKETAPAQGRGGLSGLMRRVCADIGADGYLLVELAAGRGPKALRIIASNWVYDALEDLGGEAIHDIVENGHAAGAGEAPLPLPAALPFLSQRERLALREHGHAELYLQRLCIGGRAVFALFSARAARGIDPAMLAHAHMMCCYALGGFLAADDRQAPPGALSERERECLKWVSEGKTTDEVALILGVSSNTVNSYVAHAIQKFGASNRAMAIATAIRSGVI